MTSDNTQTPQYPLKQIYFYLTEGCNLRCRHCWIAPKYQAPEKKLPDLDPDLFHQIIKEAQPLGLEAVKLTGGEPLLHSHIDELLDILIAEDIRMVMETNGVLCTRQMAEKIARCKHPFVSVSLDGADAATQEWVRGVEGCYEQTLEGIRNLVDVGLQPQIIMTLMQRNRDQIRDIIRLAESLNAGSVKFNIVQPTSRGSQLHHSGETITIEELVELGDWVENTLSRETKLQLFFSHPMAFRPMSRIFGKNGVGCGICGIFGIIGVLSNGKYALCGIGEVIPEMVFGQAGKDRLADVWNDAPMLKAIRQGLPANLEGVCGNCVMSKICLGSCIAQNYYRTKKLWAPFWYCHEASEAGLFPKTRLRHT